MKQKLTKFGFPGGTWLRIRLPTQGPWVRSLVGEDPTCRGATKPVHHNYWACALEPASHSYWAYTSQLLSLHTTAIEACMPRAHAPQQEKPQQWEAHAPKLEKACMPQRRPNIAKNNKKII